VISKGDVVEVHARGEIAGKKFWDTKDKKGTPFKYTAGVGGVIRGWDQGCLGMAIGEKRRLIIPSEEGYGKDGFPSWGISPHSTLTFVLEVVSIHVESSSATLMLRNELTKALLREKTPAGDQKKQDKMDGECHGEHGHSHGKHGEQGHDHKHQNHGRHHPSSSSSHPAVLLCKRCLSTVGTSQPRNNGTNIVRMWKCHLIVDDTTDETSGSMGRDGGDGEDATKRASFEQYLVDSIVGHSILDGMEQRGVTRYVIQSFYADDDGEAALIRDDRIDLKLTVLNPNEFAASNEFAEMQPVIRLMYQVPGDDRQEAAMEWATKHEAERILLSEEDAEEMEEHLLWTTKLLPKASQMLNGMSVGFLRW
jgi:hypothetical protein